MRVSERARLALGRKIGPLIRARPASIAWPGGVVSFTFDDFPKSALVTGGSILERHGARATYYCALKLAGTTGVLGPMFDVEDVRTAHRAGHEIACHTYTHLDCRRATGRVILEEVRVNAAMLYTLIAGYAPTNFAYPYGAVSRAAKRTVATQFSTCRGISPGINQRAVNLAELLATRIYAADFDQSEICRLIDRNRSVGGWLIFYTHDVTETPSPYGCTPGQLEGVVAYAANCATILPVRDVITGLSTGRGKPAPLESRPAIRQL